MTDYRVTIKVRNARVLRALERIGHTASSFAREHGFQPTVMCEIAAMKRSPVYRNGQWRREIMALCDAANVLPSDLFTDRQLSALDRNVVEREMDEAALVALTGHTTDSEDSALLADAKRLLSDAMATLPERVRRVLELRASGGTLEDCVAEMGTTRERMRQIEAKGLRDLRRRLDSHHDALTGLPWDAVR